MDMQGKCKYVAYGELILGTIGSAILAYRCGKGIDIVGKELVARQDWNVTVGLFVGCMFAVAVIFVILLALENILQRQDDLLYAISKLESHADSNKETPASTVRVSNARATIRDTSSIVSGTKGDEWTCPDCGETNPQISRTCRSCGRYK